MSDRPVPGSHARRPWPAAGVLASIIALASDPAQAAAQAPTPAAAVRDTADSAFASVQRRGKMAMGVDQYTSTHRFDALPDGGRVELQRDRDDPAGVATIRRHLREVARAFGAGDFATPAFVHARAVPGTRVMAARRGQIRYAVRDLPRGAELRMTTRDPAARAAIHAFVAFQRQDHHADGRANGAAVPRHESHVHAPDGPVR